ncbi:MAG TPA: RHS repeat-associated core domain-containing protein, partial [Armatimonadota bacterium]
MSNYVCNVSEIPQHRGVEEENSKQIIGIASPNDPGFRYAPDGSPLRYLGLPLVCDRDDHITRFGDAFLAGYRPDGLREWKKGGGRWTNYRYRDGQLCAEENDRGALRAFPVFGPAGLLLREVRGADGVFHPTIYLCDPQGDVLFRLDEEGDVRSADLYDAWGALRAGGDKRDPYGYRGRDGYYTDGETGLLLCGHRYYCPATGRFLTRDPLGNAGGPDLYAYCGNDPVNEVDPKGLTPEEGLAAVQANRDAIIRVAQKYHIQPELLAGVVYREVSGNVGQKPGEYKNNELLSGLKLIVKPNQGGNPASVGLAQVQHQPEYMFKKSQPGNPPRNPDLDPVPVPNNPLARAWWYYANYRSDIERQLEEGAKRIVAL